MAQPIAAYAFDGTGLVLVDDTGNGNDADIAGLARVAGHTNTGLQRPAAAAVATLPAGLGVTPLRTVMAWLLIPNTALAHWPIFWNDPAVSSGGWGILVLSGNICIQARDSSSQLARVQTAWPGGGYHHVAGTYDGTDVSLFVDGVFVNSLPLPGGLQTVVDPAALLFDAPTDTVMDDLRIFDAVEDPAVWMNVPVGTPSEVHDAVGAAPLGMGARASASKAGVVTGESPLILSDTATGTKHGASTGDALHVLGARGATIDEIFWPLMAGELELVRHVTAGDVDTDLFVR